MIKKIIFLFLVSFNFIIISKANAQSLTRKVLFLGNSYTYVNNLPQIVADIATSMGDTLIFDSNTPGGYTLDMHFTDSISTGKIMAGGWDYVVMQEQSQLPAFEDYLSNGPSNLSAMIRKYNPCARKMFYMTWGRKNGDASNCAAWPPICTYEGMDSLLHLRYIEMATLNNAEVSPVGAVWKFIRQNYPNIDLYQADESHPSAAGSYAAACCFYSVLFKKDPTLINYDYVLSSSDAAEIRSASKAVVFDSLQYWNFSVFNPFADFNYSIGSGMNEVIFQNNSLRANTFTWDYGDGNYSSDTNTIHNYSANGMYSVTLTASCCDLNQIYQSAHHMNINFCAHTPTISPDTLIICPNSIDTLWTQVYDSYQWLSDGIIIPGETNQYILASGWANYSVIATKNNCAELSSPAYVATFTHPLVNYRVDTAGTLIHPDTACIGDTLKLFLSPNKPDGGYKIVHWFNNGLPILSTITDTLYISSSGNYSVSISSPICPDYDFFTSQVYSYTFINCSIGIQEIDLNQIHVYPNPADNFLEIIINPDLLNKHYFISDITGRIFCQGYLNNELNHVELNNISGGIYFLRIEKSGLKEIKIIIN